MAGFSVVRTSLGFFSPGITENRFLSQDADPGLAPVDRLYLSNDGSNLLVLPAGNVDAMLTSIKKGMSAARLAAGTKIGGKKLTLDLASILFGNNVHFTQAEYPLFSGGEPLYWNEDDPRFVIYTRPVSDPTGQTRYITTSVDITVPPDLTVDVEMLVRDNELFDAETLRGIFEDCGFLVHLFHFRKRYGAFEVLYWEISQHS